MSDEFILSPKESELLNMIISLSIRNRQQEKQIENQRRLIQNFQMIIDEMYSERRKKNE